MPGNGGVNWFARIKVGSGWTGFAAVVGRGDMNGDRKADALPRDSGGALWLTVSSKVGSSLYCQTRILDRNRFARKHIEVPSHERQPDACRV